MERKIFHPATRWWSSTAMHSGMPRAKGTANSSFALFSSAVHRLGLKGLRPGGPSDPLRGQTIPVGEGVVNRLADGNADETDHQRDGRQGEEKPGELSSSSQGHAPRARWGGGDHTHVDSSFTYVPFGLRTSPPDSGSNRAGTCS